MRSLFKVLSLNFIGIESEVWSLNFFIQVCLNYLNSFLAGNGTGARMGSSPEAVVPKRVLFDLKFCTAKLAAKLATKPYWQLRQYEAIIRIKQSRTKFLFFQTGWLNYWWSFENCKVVNLLTTK